MAIDTEYPFTSIPRPHPVFWLGAYKNGLLQIEIPCHGEQEAERYSAVLELHGYEIRIRTGARVPKSIENE